MGADRDGVFSAQPLTNDRDPGPAVAVEGNLRIARRAEIQVGCARRGPCDGNDRAAEVFFAQFNREAAAGSGRTLANAPLRRIKAGKLGSLVNIDLAARDGRKADGADHAVEFLALDL